MHIASQNQGLAECMQLQPLVSGLAQGCVSMTTQKRSVLMHTLISMRGAPPPLMLPAKHLLYRPLCCRPLASTCQTLQITAFMSSSKGLCLSHANSGAAAWSAESACYIHVVTPNTYHTYWQSSSKDILVMDHSSTKVYLELYAAL